MIVSGIRSEEESWKLLMRTNYDGSQAEIMDSNFAKLLCGKEHI